MIACFSGGQLNIGFFLTAGMVIALGLDGAGAPASR
jgi:hypothetical protein